MALAQWGKLCEEAVKSSVEDYINATTVLIVSEYETAPIEARLKKIPFMSEPGRKLFGYNSLCREPVDSAAVKRHKRSFFAGAKVTMDLTQAGDEASDTLAVIKNIYGTFRTERPSDHLSEDVIACIVPGRSGDSPVNEVLDKAWKSLKCLGNKHIGPKIGSIRVSQEDVLAQIYTRGLWNRPPESHLLFTYQANPTDYGGRKRMRYLKEASRVGDTFFNEWPVPMLQPSQMPRCSQAEHDRMFAMDTAMDEGSEDGAGAAMIQDLGDKVVPFPREFHVKLWQELIHVFGIEAGVLFWVGSGQALLAFILERKRAVAVVRNNEMKDFVKQNLAQAVKSLGLAPDRRPPKPAELVAWEQRRAVGGVPPKAGQETPPTPSGSSAGGGAPSILPAPVLPPTATATVLHPPPPPPTGAAPGPAAIQPAAGKAAPSVLAAFGSSALR